MRYAQTGMPPRRTEYETIKEKIRAAVDSAINETSNEVDFLYVLRERYHVEVKVSRGRWSYIHGDRAKPIRDRSIGGAYDRESVVKRIQGYREIPDVVSPEFESLPKIFLFHSELRLVTDLQDCVKAQQSWAYSRKVIISNLQEMARTVAWIQEQGIETREELTQRYHDAQEQLAAFQNRCTELNIELQAINEEKTLLGCYLANKKVYGEFLKVEDKAAFRHEHTEQIDGYEDAVRRLKEIYPNHFPTMKALKEQKAGLVKERNVVNAQLKNSSKRAKELETASYNVDEILGNRPQIQRRNFRGDLTL